MASLQTYSFNQLVSNFATAVQGAASALLNFTVGSVLRALAQATAGVLLWLQAIILQLLTVTRAATSAGSDLDSWMADFNFFRLPAQAATGQVFFSRFTMTQQALLPVGTTVQTSDGTQNFTVLADTTNPAYNASLNAFLIATGSQGIVVTVQASIPGAGGNVQAGSIAVITTPVSGIDTVTNPEGYVNGIDAETDPAFLARFVLYINSLSKGTKAAIGAAIESVQQGLTYTITENFDYNGAVDDGFFYVVVNDGTGSPPSQLLDNVGSAIEAVRGLTIRYAVFGPDIITASVVMAITTAAGYDHPTVVGQVGTALENFINSIGLGETLPYTQLAAIAYGIPGVVNVSGVTLNGGTADLVATNKQVILPGTMTVS